VPAPPVAGVGEDLARERSASIHDVRYDLAFDVPADRATPVRGRVRVRFVLVAPRQVVLDFDRPASAVRRVRVGDRDVPVEVVNGHVIVPASATRTGANDIDIEFESGDDALNRGDDVLYTLFVPARARLAFPCFDQPDLKARYTLQLDVPAGWQAVANGRAVASGAAPSGHGRQRVAFATTEPLPTYLFAFVTGRFSVETGTRNGREFRVFHRETDAAKVARNRDAIIDLHAASLTWLEDYTALPYAFGKFDVVLIPSFQFGGMEHAGAILYNAASLMLDESATQNQRLERASVIAHETAHMWFGDLVTMRWFNDVWMKEVFANFMAAKIVNPSFPDVNHDLRFLLAHHPAAYQVDRTAGTNAIRQSLGNLNEAGQLYGPIIYQKAPVVMRQLELILGEQPMRDGLRDYLKQYAFGNATWVDLVRILDARTPRDLAAWSRAWVDERGRPSIAPRVSVTPAGRVGAVTLTTSDPMGRGLTWPQRLDVTVGLPGGIRHLATDVTGASVTVPGVRGLERPLYVLPAGRGTGYGLFLLDDASASYLLAHIEDVPDPLTRGVAWVTLWDNLVEGRVPPAAYFDAALRALPRETDEQNVQRVLADVERVFWRFLYGGDSAGGNGGRTARLEAALREGLSRAPSQSQKSAWFSAYRDTVLSRDGLAWLERVWRRAETVPGLTLAEPDEIAMALELAVREVPGWQEILTAQRDRTQNPDRRARFTFTMPALSADPAVREAAFERFGSVENRRREPWVLESLSYLHHPLRADHGRRFVQPSLDLLREIQRTGDIFFPSRWMDATLWGHRTADVAATVRAFLARERDYPERLRWTILTSADDLLRVNPSSTGPVQGQ
jgi:aminopeptidase N